MANIKYTRLGVTEDNLNLNPYFQRLKSKLPIAFLEQQIFLLALILSSFLLLIITLFFTTDVEYDLIRDISHDISYGVVVDCGSSGTRAHIFRWNKNAQGAARRVELLRDSRDRPINMHITPGLSSFRDNPDNASDYMEPIMNFISESIPYDRHIDTTVHFMATAGMRLLDEATQKKILNDITRDLRVKYDFPKIKSQVITGEYEGAYSWMSLNMDRFYNDTKDVKQSRSIGMIEMGGASTQVTFELGPDAEQVILKELRGNHEATTTFRKEQINLALTKDRSIKLFATTFLGLGVNSARESAVDLLIRDYLDGIGQLGDHKTDLKNFNISLKDPCLTIGSSEMMVRPAEVITSLDKSVGFVAKHQDDAFKVSLDGSGNFLNCLTLLERVIRMIKAEKLNCLPSRDSCPMVLLGTKFIPYQQHSFVGLSEMFFTTNEMINSAGLFNRSHVLRETNKICSTEYQHLWKLYSNNGVSYEDRILYECFKASWLLTILHSSGLKMPVTYGDFRTIDRIDGQEIDWTLGAMLWEVFTDEARG